MPRPATLGLALTTGLIIVGGTYLWGKYALMHVPPLVVGLLRFSVAAVLLQIGTRIFFPEVRIEKSDRGRLFVLAALVIPVNQLFFLTGLQYTTPAHSALMYSTLPIFIYAISLILREESFVWLKNIGIVTAFGGVFLILNEQGIDFQSDYVIGDLIILVAVVAWAFYTVLGRRMVRKYGAFYMTSRTLGLGTLMFLPLGIYGAIGFDFSEPPAAAYWGILYLATFTSIGAYTIWYWALKHMEASKVGVVNNFQPVVTAVMAFVLSGMSIVDPQLFGEEFSLTFMGGGLIVFAGVYMTLKG